MLALLLCCSCSALLCPGGREMSLRVTLCPGCPQGCVPTLRGHCQGHLRSRGDNDTAHPVEAAVSQVQALGSELHLPALEVLLVEDNDLGVQGKAWMRTGVLRGLGLVLGEPAMPEPTAPRVPLGSPRLPAAARV